MQFIPLHRIAYNLSLLQKMEQKTSYGTKWGNNFGTAVKVELATCHTCHCRLLPATVSENSSLFMPGQPGPVKPVAMSGLFLSY